MILLFSVDEQTVTRTDSNSGLVNLSVDYLSLSFSFDENSVWDDLEKKVEFYAKDTGVYDLELENDSVTVPFEVLTGDYFIFSLYGVDGDLRVTTNKMKIYLKESGFIGDGVAPGDDKRTVIQVINDRIDGLDVTVGLLGDDVESVVNTVNGHSTALSNLGDDVTGLVGSVSALSSSVDVIGDDVDSLETTVNAVSDTVDGLESTVNDNTGNISYLSEKVDDIRGYMDDIYTKLDNTVEMTVEYTDGTTETFDVVVK